jgi:hypothetical protein
MFDIVSASLNPAGLNILRPEIHVFVSLSQCLFFGIIYGLFVKQK